MKSMKIASVAMLAMVGLGFAASPASAAVNQGGQSGTSTAKVDIKGATGFNRDLTLKSVPSEYNFETTVKDSTYSMVANKTITNGEIKVFKNYTGSDTKEVRAKISPLTVSSGGAAATVDSFKINGISVTGTANSARLYKDSDFHKVLHPNVVTSGTLSKAVTSAEISFTRSGLTVGDKLTGTITYEVANYVSAP